MNIQTLPLSAITGISQLNPRHDEDDVTQLAATIKAAGLQYPLLVMANPDAPGTYEVLDGGRRWRALKSFMSDWEEIPVEVHEGDEHSARRATLAVSITPRALHPVAEFEAFAKLLDAGFDVPAIARDFALTERHVRQRLALGNLAPCVRDAWRKGEISRDSAEAFTLGGIEAQEALFNSWAGTVYAARLQRPYEIRQGLRGDAMDADEPLARYFAADPARLDAYRAAGGRIEEDLFSEEVGLRDKPIAERAARELLLASAASIAAAEGWGAMEVSLEALSYGRLPKWEFASPLTEEERRLEEELEDEIENGDDDAARAAEERRDALLTTAILRKCSPDERARLCVVAVLEWDGRASIVRGVEPLDAEPRSAPSEWAGESGEALETEEDDLPGQEPESVEEEPEEVEGPFAEPRKALRPVIEAGVTTALREATSRRVDLALMFAVAALGCQYGVIGLAPLRPIQFIDGEASDLLRRIRPLAFPKALAECAAASTNDLTTAFARLIGQAFDTRGATMTALSALIGAARARGANMVAAFGDAVDRRGFFDAAPKSQVLKIVAGLIGEGEAKRCKSMDRAQLADYAARLSRDKGHLPSPFADWAHLPALPEIAKEAMIVGDQTALAQAMAEAIDADEKTRVTGNAKGKTKAARAASATTGAARKTKRAAEEAAQ